MTLSHNRIRYLDIAKGMLILIVIYNHIANLAVASEVHNDTIDFIPQTHFFSPFFMPAFFIITGMCSNYHRDFKSFFIKNAKSLLIPAISLLFVRIFVRYILTGTISTLEWNSIMSRSALFNLGYWNWFLTALFTTKIIFYVVANNVNSIKNRIIVTLFVHVIGVILWNYNGDGILYYNFYFYQHALMYLVFIEIGYETSRENIKVFGLLTNAASFFTIYIIYLIIGIKLPSITAGPYLPISDIFPHLVMAISGSFMILSIAKLMNENSFFESFGRHSLVIYCLHFQFMFSFYEIFKVSLNNMGVHYTITSLVVLYVFTASGCLLCSVVLNYKKVRWILGKF